MAGDLPEADVLLLAPTATTNTATRRGTASAHLTRRGCATLKNL